MSDGHGRAGIPPRLFTCPCACVPGLAQGQAVHTTVAEPRHKHKKTRHLDGRTSKKVQNNSSCPGFQKQAQGNSDTKKGIRKRTGRNNSAGHAGRSPDRLRDLTGRRNERQKKPAGGGEIRYGKYPDIILTSGKSLSSSKG